MSKLVIVESPAKAKTIKKYLGSGYEVVASMGHIRDLPEKRLSVDIRHGFKPKYDIIKGKEELAEELKKRAAKSEEIFLATDPDREGEAISWHLAYLLDLPLDEKNRVTFNEITQTGVTNGMANPRCIDIDLVNAQQARRILDRLVGYKLSPFLAQKIRKGLSAGRVHRFVHLSLRNIGLLMQSLFQRVNARLFLHHFMIISREHFALRIKIVA